MSETHRFTRLPDLPVILGTVDPEFSMQSFPDMLQELSQLLDTELEPVFYVGDVIHLTLSFNDLLNGADIVKSDRSVLRHPKLREFIVVSPNRAIHLAAQGLKHTVFNNLNVPTFNTVEDALSYIRTK